MDGKPPVFYVSLNFLFGDQASTERRWFENIELKWLLQGSDSPFDSIGFGVGLRGHYAKRFGFDFDLLSPSWPGPGRKPKTRRRDACSNSVRSQHEHQQGARLGQVSTWPLTRGGDYMAIIRGQRLQADPRTPKVQRRVVIKLDAAAARRHRAAGSARTRQ